MLCVDNRPICLFKHEIFILDGQPLVKVSQVIRNKIHGVFIIARIYGGKKKLFHAFLTL